LKKTEGRKSRDTVHLIKTHTVECSVQNGHYSVYLPHPPYLHNKMVKVTAHEKVCDIMTKDGRMGLTKVRLQLFFKSAV
jgi:hypothetical protein